jgi:hypothetical protein
MLTLKETRFLEKEKKAKKKKQKEVQKLNTKLK